MDADVSLFYIILFVISLAVYPLGAAALVCSANMNEKIYMDAEAKHLFGIMRILKTIISVLLSAYLIITAPVVLASALFGFLFLGMAIMQIVIGLAFIVDLSITIMFLNNLREIFAGDFRRISLFLSVPIIDVIIMQKMSNIIVEKNY